MGELLFLGTGGSMGVPIIGCHCAVCSSSYSKNKRLRPSLLLKLKEKVIVVDAGPDFRTQALRHRIDDIDGVIFTHAHHDHTAGLDDLRVYAMRRQDPIPCLTSLATADDLKRRFDYIFSNKKKHQLVSKVDMHILEGERGKADFLGIEVKYLTYYQAGMPVNGFRIGNLSFISDIKDYSSSIFEDLQGIDILVLSALRFGSSRLHFSIGEAIEFASAAGAKQTWLTHIAHEVDHEHANEYLPSNVQLAYDGLSFQFQY